MEKSPTRNNQCPVCKTNIGLLSKKVECSNCKLTVCRDHSYLHENSNHFCNLCEKLSIKNQNFADFTFQIQSLKSDLQYLEKDKNKYKKEILMKNDTINRLDKQLKANSAQHNEKIENLDKKVLQEQKKITSEEKLSEHLEQSLKESEKSERVILEKLNSGLQELHEAGIEFEELKTDSKFLINKIDSLRSQLRGVVPINRIKPISCENCFKRFRQEFSEVFQTASILEGRDSIVSNVSLVMDQVNEARESCVCKACNII